MVRKPFSVLMCLVFRQARKDRVLVFSYEKRELMDILYCETSCYITRNKYSVKHFLKVRVTFAYISLNYAISSAFYNSYFKKYWISLYIAKFIHRQMLCSV